jgi:hypothetical protein
MNELHITIPNYLRKVQLTKGKRKKYYLNSDATIPKKYNPVLNSNYIWKDDKIFDTVTKQFVVKNEASSKVPRYQAVSGNEIMRVHERKRMKVVDALKEQFKNYLPGVGSKLYPPTPWKISMKMYSPAGKANFDVDNFWIYHKCFMDSLEDIGVIPNDCIVYVPKGGGTEFHHVENEEDSKMIFTIETTESCYEAT